jgi:acyl dehydratase
LISAVLGTKLPGPGAIYLDQKLRFQARLSGDTITARVEVTAHRAEKGVVTLNTGCFNQNGEEVLTGEATLLTG